MKFMEKVAEIYCRFIICVIQLQGLTSVLLVSTVVNLVNQKLSTYYRHCIGVNGFVSCLYFSSLRLSFK